MMAVQTTLRARDLPDDLAALRSAIECADYVEAVEWAQGYALANREPAPWR